MSRAAVFDALVNSADLNAIGIDETSVFHNYSLEQRPIAEGPFIILRWGDSEAPVFRDAVLGDTKSAVRLVLWGNFPVEMTTDYNRLENLLDLCDDALSSLSQTDGGDGYVVTTVRCMGRGGDFKDDGFQTITKNAGYEILSRRVKESV